MSTDTVPAARFVGQRVKRREDPRLLSGHGRYADDISLPGQLHVAFLRSDVAAGRIRSIETDTARAFPGVVAVFTGADLNTIAGPMWTTTNGPNVPTFPFLPLAGDDVRFVGDPVALVVATSRYIAEDACELIELDVESTPAVVTLESACAAGAPVVHPEVGTNVLGAQPQPDPELDRILSGAAHVVTRTFAMTRTTNVPMEGRGLVASYDAHRGDLQVWPSTQSPHEIKAFSSRVLGIGENRIRVEFGDVGGGFGQKMYPSREEAAVLLAAKLLGRPVKWIEDRRENLIAANQARHDVATVTMAADAEGHLLAATVHLRSDLGAYPAGGAAAGSGGFVAMLFSGPYRLAKVGFSAEAVFTNTCGNAPFLSIAAGLLEAAEADLEVSDSVVSVRGTRSKALTFAELASTAYLNAAMLPPGIEAGLEVTARFQPPAPFTWSNATHVCTCEVDPGTGEIALRRFVVSEDCGVMINPMVVEGQIAGGVAQGIGGALYEEMAYDESGNPLASTFLDYLIPTVSDVPEIEYGHVETPSASLGGYKGMGEGGAIASPAAVANAVNDALAPLGARLEQFPITPWRVLEAIAAAGAR